MFIRKNLRRYKDKTYINYTLVESVHTDKGPRQRTICPLGDLSPRPRAEWLKLAHRVEQALAGEGDLFAAPDPEVEGIVARAKAAAEAPRRRRAKTSSASGEEAVPVLVKKAATEDHREAGAAHVGVQFWRRLSLDAILSRSGLSARARTLSCVMVMNRLIRPCSEHAMPEWVNRTALGDILGEDFSGLNDDALYRVMDELHPRRAEIEAGLSAQERDLYNLDQTVYLYDLTSTYFEGLVRANPKAQRGYSRDSRPDCKQVVVGLVVNRDGFPLGHEVFAGNTLDLKSLPAMLDALDRRVGLRAGQTVVVDRGMAYAENLAQIQARGLHYIVAARQPERDQWLSEFEDETGFIEVVRQPSPRNPGQKKTRIQVKRARRGGTTYVLCLSDGRRDKDRAIRDKHERRLLADLAKLEARVREGRLVKADKIHEAIGRLKERYPRVARYYRIEYAPDSGLRVALDAAKREKAAQLDGSYLLKTDREDLDAEELWRIYSLLTRAENAFRNLKSPLAERPIFHRFEHRVDTHVFLCVLAYHLLTAIEKTLLDRGIHSSWAAVRDALSTHQVCTVVLPTPSGDTLKIRQGSNPEPAHRELYDLLAVPHQVMAPLRTWVYPEPKP